MHHEGNEEKNWKEVAQELGRQFPNKLKVGQACVCVGQCGIHQKNKHTTKYVCTAFALVCQRHV